MSAFELTIINVVLLSFAGILAGFVNTLAGGGAMITVPLLILMGVPADVANGTIRLSVVTQSLTAVGSFSRHKVLEDVEIWPILWPTILGTLAGAFSISLLTAELVKYVLLVTMLFMALLIMFVPNKVFVEEGEKSLKMSEAKMSRFWMFIAGFYGGAIQAGVGFVLLAIFGAILRFDLLKGNAMKMVCTTLFGSLSLLVFVVQGQVWWIPAIILAISSAFGVLLSVRFALKADQDILKKILLLMVMVACVGALFS